MKTTFLTALMALIIAVAYAQPDAILEFHEKFKDTGKYVSVRVEGGLLKFLSNVETDDEDTDDFIKAISKLESIDLHAINKHETGFNSGDYKSFMKSVQKAKYDELMIIRDGDTHVDFLVKERKGKISDLLMVIDERDEFVLLNFTGEIDLAALARLSDELNIKGAEHLKKMEDKN